MEMRLKQEWVKKYPAYKDSGIGWLWEIPEHWELRKLKHIFYEKEIIHNNLHHIYFYRRGCI